MSEGAYVVRTMTRPELDVAVDWAAAQGCNPGLHDANCFHAADPEGFLIGLLEDEPVATISVDEVSAYDRPFFPDNRVRFLKCWISQPEGCALGFVRNGSLAGYGVLPPLPFRIQSRAAIGGRSGNRRIPVPGVTKRYFCKRAGFPGHTGRKRRCDRCNEAPQHDTNFRNGTHGLQATAHLVPCHSAGVTPVSSSAA